MPSDDLLLHCQKDLALEGHWRVNGRHYQRTGGGLAGQPGRPAVGSFRGFPELLHGPEAPERRVQRWRLFFLACAELWGCRRGDEWP